MGPACLPTTRTFGSSTCGDTTSALLPTRILPAATSATTCTRSGCAASTSRSPTRSTLRTASCLARSCPSTATASSKATCARRSSATPSSSTTATRPWPFTCFRASSWPFTSRTPTSSSTTGFAGARSKEMVPRLGHGRPHVQLDSLQDSAPPRPPHQRWAALPDSAHLCPVPDHADGLRGDVCAVVVPAPLACGDGPSRRERLPQARRDGGQGHRCIGLPQGQQQHELLLQARRRGLLRGRIDPLRGRGERRPHHQGRLGGCQL